MTLNWRTSGMLLQHQPNMMCLVKSLFGIKTINKLERVNAPPVVHLYSWCTVTLHIFVKNWNNAPWDTTTLKKNMVRHTVRKTKQKLKSKLVLNFKRILWLRYIYLLKALQIQVRGVAIGATTDKHHL